MRMTVRPLLPALKSQPAPAPKTEGVARSVGSRRGVLAAGYLLIAASFLSFGLSRDRYPVPFCDDSFFTYPAMRYLEGKGLNYDGHPKAPHGATLWAYHGPFFPRLQVLTVSLFGPTEFSCRFPQYVAAHLALVVLFTLLVCRGLALAAFALVVGWWGDRSFQELLYGRMEGIVLLNLAGSIAMSLRAAERRSPVWAFGGGLCLGTAAGFSPSVICFFPAALAALWMISTPRPWRRLALASTAGCLVPLVAIVACWMPHPIDALQQMAWNRHFTDSRAHMSRVQQVWRLLGSMDWAIPWLVGTAVVAIFLVCSLAKRYRQLRRAPSLDDATRVEIFAAAFAVAGFMCLVGTTISTHYLALFTIWPLLGLIAHVAGRGRNVSWAVRGLALLILLAWLPSCLWNARRCRESVLSFRAMDRAPGARVLASVVPAGARLTGSPEFLFLARMSGRPFEPLPWFVRNLKLSPGDWIGFSPDDWYVPPPEQWLVLAKNDAMPSPEVVAARLHRRIAFRGCAFPGATYSRYPFFVFTPADR